MDTTKNPTDKMTVHFSSESDNWATPQDYFDRLSKLFNFTLDPCASADNAKCPRYFDQAADGLSQSWETPGAVWVNPPYGRSVGQWARKAYEESRKGTPVVCLLPARTDTRWFHDYCTKGIVHFISGRLKFGEATTSAPFPSMLVIFANFDSSASRQSSIDLLAA